MTAEVSGLTDCRNQMRARGYAHFPRLVPEPLVAAAREAIGRDLRESYEPGRVSEDARRRA